MPKIIDIEEIEYDNDVYNLHVQDNHNYLANGIIISNCHGVKSDVLKSIITDHCGHVAIKFGVTGTLPKDKTDLMNIKMALGSVRYEKSAHELIAKSWLASVNIHVIKTQINLNKQYRSFIENENPDPIPSYNKFRRCYLPEWQHEKEFISRDLDRLQYIANLVTEISANGNVLCLVNGIAIGKKLAKLTSESVFLYGQDDIEVREEIYKKFATSNNLKIYANAPIAQQGLDIERIFNLCFIDIGKSFIRVIQSIGRGLRKASDKDHLEVYDICSDLKYGSQHLKDRLEYYKEARYPFDVVEITYGDDDDHT